MVTIESLRYGVEIECGGQTRETVAHAFQAIVGGTVHRIGSASADAWGVRALDGREWSIVADSSLAAYAPELRIEVVTPILTWDDLPTLQAVVRALRGAGCATNGQAGLHVHVGAERFTGKALAILAKQVYANEALIFHAFAVSEERKARYTRPLDPAFIARLLRSRPTTRDAFFHCWYGARQYSPTRYHPTRYALLNMNSAALRDTVEFRAYTPDGLHAGKIKAAIVFSLALCARALNTRAATARQKPYDPRSAKYDMRVLLLRLNLSGPEHAHTRKHLLARMPGDSAFKYAEQRPKRRSATPKTDTTPRAEAETLRPSC